MTFQKTSLALLLALPLAAAAADFPLPPSEPAGFIPGLPVLHAAKEAYIAQTTAESAPPTSAVPLLATARTQKEGFPDVVPFEIPGQVKKPVVQNECSDFTPVTDMNHLIWQLYHHMKFDCLRHPDTNNLETLLGIPVLTLPVGEIHYDSLKPMELYEGKFFLVQLVTQDRKDVIKITVEISKKFFDYGGNIFENRSLPPIPEPEIYKNLGDTAHSWDFYKFNRLHFSGEWGDFSPKSYHIWTVNKTEMEIANWYVAGSERFTLYFRD